MPMLEPLAPVEWVGSAEHGSLRLLDQRRLPGREAWLECREVQQVAEAIRDMAVRGAPAIGLAAAYGMVLAPRGTLECSWPFGLARRPAKPSSSGDSGIPARLLAARDLLAATRPTAVNLFWALARMAAAARIDPSPAALLARAQLLDRENAEANLRLSEIGAARIEAGMGILTHCNAGAIAAGGVGTALGVIATAHQQGKQLHVFVDETRPRLQGARLTAWELGRLGIPHTLICDSAAAALMGQGRIQLAVVGADRIAANGEVANKIGTYGVAVAAKHHGLPFHVAAPTSTFDLDLLEGRGIPIEERDEAEITHWGEERSCPIETRAFNPAFDITPASLIESIFTERGEIAPVGPEAIVRMLGPPRGGAPAA